MTDVPRVSGSIVIPAWNEADAIGRTLVGLFAGLDVSEIDVVVACNGCTDGTADIARSTNLPVVVLDLGHVGKVGAINAGERQTDRLPRIYLDADTGLSGISATAVLRALGEGAVAARPPVHFVTDRSSWPVRSFYKTKQRLPGVAGDLCGAGVYGLSADARARFAEFPEVRGDDLFAARVVRPEEVAIVDTEPVRVFVPRTARAQIRVLARTYRGNRELSVDFPDLAHPTTSSTVGQLWSQLRSGHVIDVVVYCAFVVAGRLASMRPQRSWARDDSSRTPGSAKVAA